MRWLLRVREWAASTFRRSQDIELREAYARLRRAIDALDDSNSRTNTATEDEAGCIMTDEPEKQAKQPAKQKVESLERAMATASKDNSNPMEQRRMASRNQNWRAFAWR